MSRLKAGEFAKYAAPEGEWLDYLRAANPLAVYMESPKDQRVGRQLRGWGSAATSALVGGIGGRIAGPRTGLVAGALLPGVSALQGSGFGRAYGLPLGAALGAGRANLEALRGARAARMEQEAAERALREAAEQAAMLKSRGGALVERVMSAARKNPIVAGLGAGALGAAALT